MGGGPPAPSFYEPLGAGRYRATAATAGPWREGAQHGGPPTALLTRAVERVAPREGMHLARLTCEILGPVPLGELTVDARVARPGRSVELLEATLSADGKAVATMRAWRVAATPADVPLAPAAGGSATDPDGDCGAPPPMPDTSTVLRSADWLDGYLSAIEWRFVCGGFDQPGPATVWTRALVPLLPDEEPTPAQRVALVADIGNGVSHELPIAEWYFINPELTVHLFRQPVGEWIGVRAHSSIAPGGGGHATSRLYDAEGAIGRGNQALLVARR